MPTDSRPGAKIPIPQERTCDLPPARLGTGVILNSIFAALALLSLGLTVWQWLAARKFPLHKRVPRTGHQSGVTLLKPLKGCDDHTESCLRSWFEQDYAGEVHLLFGVASDQDPACGVVKKLLAEFPQRDAQLILCAEQVGPNAKASKLAQLEPFAKHEIIVASDADVRAPADLLVNLIVSLNSAHTSDVGVTDIPLTRLSATLSPAGGEGRVRGQNTSGNFIVQSGEVKVGLVSCFYRLANPTTLAMHWEAIATNADFWSQVLQNASFRKLDFALGAVMATRRQQLSEIGGFKALADCLADDNQLGRRLAQRGYRIEMCPVVVECWSEPMGWREAWKHQLRWARTIRVCQPLPYFFSILNNVTFWSLVWIAAAGAMPTFENHTLASGGFVGSLSVPRELIVATTCMLARVAAAIDLQRRLAPMGAHSNYFWLVPIKDLLQVALWAGAFLGNHIEWRGQRYRLRRDGTLVVQTTKTQSRSSLTASR